MYTNQEQDLPLGEEQLPAASSAGISLEDVDVVVRCEVATVKLSLARLSQLKVGDSLELTKWPNTVRLMVNSRPVAEGVLIEVSGMLAVKITRKL